MNELTKEEKAALQLLVTAKVLKLIEQVALLEYALKTCNDEKIGLKRHENLNNLKAEMEQLKLINIKLKA